MPVKIGHNRPPKTFVSELISLAKKILLAIVAIWISLYLFDVFVAPQLGLKQFQIQVTSSVAIIVISLVVITAVRGLVNKASAKIGPQLSATISFFTIVTVSLITIIVLMNEWQVNPQNVLIGGGVAAIIIGIALSTIVGNILSGGLMLTTFPAKIGDPIFVVNDNIHGIVEEISFMYTKVISETGTEYIVPNSAIVQGTIRIMKEARIIDSLPYAAGEHVEISYGDEKYTGKVTKISSRFTSLTSDDGGKEIVIPNISVMSGKFIIIKDKRLSK